MSVLALLLVLLLSMVSTATRLWKSNENRVDSYREARAAINIIASDLASLYANSNQTFFNTNKDNLSSLPVSHAEMNGGIFFLTALPSGAQEEGKNKSDLCTVGYYLGYDKTSLTNNGTESYNLYRYFRSSDDTFTAISKGNMLDGVNFDTATTSVTSEVLAKNITGFAVAAYTIQPDGKIVKFDKKAETPAPDMIEITLTAINNDVAKRFAKNQASWEDKSSITRQQNDRTFKTRVYLSGAAEAKATPTPTPAP